MQKAICLLHIDYRPHIWYLLGLITMARELYYPVSTVDIPAKTVSTIDGKRIDNRYSPLKRGHIPHLATVVTDNP